MIAGLFAVDENGGMGLNGSMPWPTNKDDLKWFKNTTTNQVVVMGRNTWDSPDMPSPLPKRENVVFTTRDIDNENVIMVSGDVCEHIRGIQESFPTKNVFIIGGPDLLSSSKPLLERIYITKIFGEYNCDVNINLETFLDGFTFSQKIHLGSCIVEEWKR